MARKYSQKTQDHVEKTMRKMKRGKLESGGSGKKVKSRKQAVAIALSEAREKGYKTPAEKSSSRKSASGSRKRKSSATGSRDRKTSRSTRSMRSGRSRSGKTASSRKTSRSRS